jgi:hypothetical protein
MDEQISVCSAKADTREYAPKNGRTQTRERHVARKQTREIMQKKSKWDVQRIGGMMASVGAPKGDGSWGTWMDILLILEWDKIVKHCRHPRYFHTRGQKMQNVPTTIRSRSPHKMRGQVPGVSQGIGDAGVEKKDEELEMGVTRIEPGADVLYVKLGSVYGVMLMLARSLRTSLGCAGLEEGVSVSRATRVPRRKPVCVCVCVCVCV